MITWVKKIFEDNHGNPSSKRMAEGLIVISFIVEWWKHIIYDHSGLTFDPNWTTVSLVAAIIGIVMWGKQYER